MRDNSEPVHSVPLKWFHCNCANKNRRLKKRIVFTMSISVRRIKGACASDYGSASGRHLLRSSCVRNKCLPLGAYLVHTSLSANRRWLPGSRIVTEYKQHETVFFRLPINLRNLT